jgi:methyl-accepting chemotaxis protein
VATTKETESALSKCQVAAKNIDGTLNLIGKLTGQTNLLALNAAIEAARAGEAGKGFGVVAKEVKELSLESARATDEISREIENMHLTLKNMASSITAVRDRADAVRQSSTAISETVSQQVTATNEISQNATLVLKDSEHVAEL